MLITNAVTRKWTVDEYLRLAENGAFDKGPRVELVEGEIVVMSQPGPSESYAIRKGIRAFFQLYEDSHEVSVRCPLRISQMSLPEPDFTLVPIGAASPTAYLSRADLVVEVAFSSLAYDLGEKADLYAKAGIPDYWVVDLVNSRVVVHRDPGPQRGKRGKAIYGSIENLSPGDSVQPVTVPGPPCPLASFFG